MTETYFISTERPDLTSQRWESKQHFSHADVHWSCPWNVGTDWETQRPTLLHLFVPENARGQGHGRLLLNKIIGYAKRRRIKELWFSNFNPEFWEACGLKIRWKEKDRSIGAIVVC